MVPIHRIAPDQGVRIGTSVPLHLLQAHLLGTDLSIDYYAKKVLPYERIESLASSSMSLRSLARELAISCGSVQNRIDRLSRQGIALHSQFRPRAALRENVCFDGLVSFDRSQYYPSDIGLSISSSSRFILGLSHATTRRSGTLSVA